jgi:WD40 repeat protein
MSREVAALIAAAMIGLAWVSIHDPGEKPARMRLARGADHPRGQSRPLAFAYSPDGTTIATIHADERVALRSPTEGWRIQRFLGYRGMALALAFSPDGRSLALGGSEPEITVYALDATGAGRPTRLPIPSTLALAFSPDGRTLAATPVRSDYIIILWDPATGRERSGGRGHSSPVLSLAFAPDGRSLASGGSEDQSIVIWDLATGRPRRRLPMRGRVTALAYAPDGSVLASASGFEDGTVRLCDPASGRLVRSIASHATSRNAIAFTPCGRLLATAEVDGRVRLWSVATGELVASLDDRADFLRGVAFSPDGRTLAAIGNVDDHVRLWDMTEVIGTPAHR